HLQSSVVEAVPKQYSVAPAAMPEGQLVCPKYGSGMVKRKAAKGPNAGMEFYGCSNYPRCRCIINIQSLSSTGGITLTKAADGSMKS
ncbi:MAG: topoisomerase DNA-binding C4 zinc finger domain-containing protein, partial [Oscillospiraceae bacterium]